MSLLDNAFGVSPLTLQYRSERSAQLAANIANAATPGYLAKDYDFESALQHALNTHDTGLRSENPRHIPVQGHGEFGDTLYRVPTKAVSNGNTVEEEIEQAAFSENALRYQSSLQFLNGSIRSLRLAIKGE